MCVTSVLARQNSSSNATSQGKQRLRRLALSRRVVIHGKLSSEAADRIEKFGRDFFVGNPLAVVGGYWPMRDEINCCPLLKQLNTLGWNIALPCITGSNRPLLFKHWEPGHKLEQGPFKTSEPSSRRAVLEPTVMLVPLVAFDAEGYRLGYGGGFYDRSIAALRAKSAITTIGLAYDEQEVVKVPNERHDERLDWILTPSGARLTRA